MSAIDNYRTSQLVPPVLDLIECLKQIDVPLVEKYLDNDELKMTIYLYQQALDSPFKHIDLDNFDLDKFHTALRVNLRAILRGHLKCERYITNRELLHSLKTPDAPVSLPECYEYQDPASSGAGSSSKKELTQKKRVKQENLEKNQRRELQRVLRRLHVGLEQPEPESGESGAPALEPASESTRPPTNI